jgi:mono/diheme cytochrome c family protein
MWPKLFIIAITLAASTASACPKCGLFGNKCVVRQQSHHVQQVVTPQVYLGAPSINYFVGQEIRVEAIVQQALRQDPGYAEYQKFKAWQAGQALSAQQAQVQPAQQPADPLNKPTETIPQTIPTAMLTQKCGTCHGGDAPKKGLLLDGTAKLTCEQMARAMKRVQDGSMPPKGSLTGEERGDVFQELLDLVETKP